MSGGRIVTYEGMDAVLTALSDGLGAHVGADRVAEWSVPRGGYRPVLRVAGDGDGPRAAVFTTARPATSAVTLVHPWWTDERSLRMLTTDVEDEARRHGAVALKWRAREGRAPASCGFTALRAPFGAVGTETTHGAVRWLVDLPHDEPGYYAQTTLFTCGAVAALMAVGLQGAPGFAGDGGDRDLELDYWRRASNFPACEPVGLAVATAEHLSTRGVEIVLDTTEPVLMEEYDGFDRAFRVELQAESRRRAARLGLPVEDRRVGVGEIARRVADGELALLLIDEAPMHGEHGPHWVLAHASDGRDVVVIEDPWVNRASGETWVDVHELPVRLSDLDRLVRWSDTGYRGVVFLRR